MRITGYHSTSRGEQRFVCNYSEQELARLLRQTGAVRRAFIRVVAESKYASLVRHQDGSFTVERGRSERDAQADFFDTTGHALAEQIFLGLVADQEPSSPVPWQRRQALPPLGPGASLAKNE